MAPLASTPEERLQRLEDLFEIHQLFVEYGHYLDQGDFAAFAGLFAEDGEILLGPLGRAKGRVDIEATMRRALDGRSGSSYHVISSPIVQLNGDLATSEVMWTVVARGASGAPELTMIGRHRDDLVRQDGRWRFQRRRGFVDIPSTYPGGREEGSR